MGHLVPELVEFATAIMTLHSGDVIACGTNHEGLGPLQDGEVVDFEIHGVGRMRLHVRDPLKRTWEKGIYIDRKSTRLNSSHVAISYAVFCLKKKRLNLRLKVDYGF